MARTLIRNKIHRHCFKFYLSGLIFCIFVVFLLTICNSLDNTKRNTQTPQESRDVLVDSRRVPKVEEIIPKVKNLNATLAVFVMSAPSHLENRNVIRQTWAFRVPTNTCVYFVLGTGNLKPEEKKSIMGEKDKYNDLAILDDFVESYSTLTWKLVETLKWTDDNIKMDYFMKVDEDTFVRLDQVLNELK